MLVIVGASASGKTEIANILVSQFSYTKSVTTTTRQKRVHEIDDIHYHFVSLALLLRMKFLNSQAPRISSFAMDSLGYIP